MGGPQSWNPAKKRLKRPRTGEAKASVEQNVGKLLRPQRRKDYQPPVQPLRKPTKTRDEKRVRALTKKLRELDQLQTRFDAGESLDAQQRAKLATLARVLDEFESITG